MGRIVGIDLGTCYSSVATPGHWTGPGFRGDSSGGSVILDRLFRDHTPSVVAENDGGEMVVGSPAKARAGRFPAPILFAKRWLGEDKTFYLPRHGALRPEEVCAHILRHLKQMAEERLGEGVDEAVLTLPAVAPLRAKQALEASAALAGLEPVQVVPAAVAAALMFAADDPSDPLRVLMYDFGGGGFKVAIVEKRDGTVSTGSILALDGDRFLGGCDLDRSLAVWMLDRLNAQGYDLDLNLENPADRAIFDQLLVYAEQTKINLSISEEHAIWDTSTGIMDHSGNRVVVDLAITRQEFEALIAQQVERSLDVCRRMWEKASP